MSESQRTNSTGDGTEGKPPSRSSLGDRSPPDLDEAILTASRRAVRFHRLTVLLEALHLSPATHWQLFVALTIGLLVGLGLERFITTGPEPEPEPTPIIHAQEPSLRTVEPPDVSEVLSDVGKMTSPESWLESIATLVRQGRIAEAESALRAFKQTYPDYASSTAP